MNAAMSGAQTLISTVVRFRAARESAAPSARDLFESVTPAHRPTPGLIRRYYLAEGALGGGLYLWKNREAAERFYTEDWRRELTSRFGVQPDVLFIERPATND